MNTPVDRLRKTLQQKAAEIARNRSVPSARHARAIVEQMLREQGGELPPPLTIASLTEELCRALGAA